MIPHPGPHLAPTVETKITHPFPPLILRKTVRLSFKRGPPTKPPASLDFRSFCPLQVFKKKLLFFGDVKHTLFRGGTWRLFFWWRGVLNLLSTHSAIHLLVANFLVVPLNLRRSARWGGDDLLGPTLCLPWAAIRLRPRAPRSPTPPFFFQIHPLSLSLGAAQRLIGAAAERALSPSDALILAGNMKVRDLRDTWPFACILTLPRLRSTWFLESPFQSWGRRRLLRHSARR